MSALVHDIETGMIDESVLLPDELRAKLAKNFFFTLTADFEEIKG